MIRYRTDATYPASPTDGTFLTSKVASPGSSDSFTHMGLNSDTTYYYTAFAYDEVSNYSLSTHASATPLTTGTTIGLDQGWQLISLYCQPDNTNIENVLSSILGKYVSVWAYIDGSWKVYDPDNPGFSDLTTMEAGRGYWVNMNEDASLNVSGSAPSNSISLVSAWNLVGYNSSISQAVDNALASIQGKYISVWAYIDGSWKVYDPDNPGFSDLTIMEPGYGYWINATEACTWILP